MIQARLPLLLAALAVLSACGAPSDRAMVASALEQPGHMAVTPRAEAPAPPAARPAPAATPPAPAVAAASAPRPAPAPAPAAPRPRRSLAELSGLHADLVVDRLGRPTLIQTESPGQVWLYRQPQCALHVFLYDEAGGYKVRHVETRSPSGKPPVDGEACYQAVAGEAPNRALARD